MARFAIARAVSCVQVIAVMMASLSVPLRADGTLTPADNTSWHDKTATVVEPSTETWLGIEGYRRVASLYTGMTWSPFSNLRQDGFRVRVVGGEGTYSYSGSRFDPAANVSVTRDFAAKGLFVDALLGWQWSSGGTTIKAFGGWSLAANRIAPYDPETRIQGAAHGLKAALEVWQNWTPTLWTSLDVSAASVFTTYSAQIRSGFRLNEGWSLGPEAALIGNVETSVKRFGVFARFDDLKNEFTLSGGVAQGRGDAPTAYGTAQYLRRY